MVKVADGRTPRVDWFRSTLLVPLANVRSAGLFLLIWLHFNSKQRARLRTPRLSSPHTVISVSLAGVSEAPCKRGRPAAVSSWRISLREACSVPVDVWHQTKQEVEKANQTTKDSNHQTTADKNMRFGIGEYELIRARLPKGQA